MRVLLKYVNTVLVLMLTIVSGYAGMPKNVFQFFDNVFHVNYKVSFLSIYEKKIKKNEK